MIFSRGFAVKIAVIGCPGSGKSTLALQLHKILNIPLFHLDQYFWQPGWQRPDRDEFVKIHNALCDGASWITDGMATRYLGYRAERADIIIFLDVPWYICLFRIFKRAFLNFGKVFFSSAPGCPERFPDREFLTYVWNFNKEYRPRIDDILEKYEGQKKIFIIKTNAELKNFIKNCPLNLQ